MIQLNYRDSKPIYEQVKDGFRKLIVQGIMEVDEKLPSVREMASTLAINPNTIQRAYRELEQEGYLYAIPGRGSFVAGVPDGDDARKNELLRSFDVLVEELFFLRAEKEELIRRVEYLHQELQKRGDYRGEGAACPEREAPDGEKEKRRSGRND